MPTGLDHPGATVEYTLDGAAILSAPADHPTDDEVAQLHDEGFVNLVSHWYDVETDRDFSEFRRAD